MRKSVLITFAAAALAAAPAMAQATGEGSGTTPRPPVGSTRGGATAQGTVGTTGSLPSGTRTGARQATDAAKKGSMAVSAADKSFAKEAAIGGMAEVELGNLAKEKASNDDVKQFGDRMVTDHGKANDELKSWASANNVTLPTQLDAKHKAVKDRLAKLSGAAFDKAYMRDMVQDHKQDVAKFKHESTAAHNPDLKAWAGKTLPTLQDHLKQAQDTASKVGVGTKSAKPGKSKGGSR